MTDQDPIQVYTPPPPPSSNPYMMSGGYPPPQYQPLPPEQEGGSRGCLIACGVGCLGLAAVIALVLLTGVVSVNSVVGGFRDLLGTVANLPPPVANVSSTQTLVTGIQPLGQLVSVSTQLAKADIYVGIQQGALNTCGFGANHVAQGSIEAGLDLTRLTEADIRYDETRSTYIITVPAAQLTSCRVDYIRQYDRTTTVCPVDWDEARLLAQYTALLDFRDDAIEGGILDRAQSEARIVLVNFVRLLTGRNVEIVFAQPETRTLPPSCNPDTPQNWRMDPLTGQWIQG